ncbi:mucin-associated surface protein [Arthrobacter sp. K5]|uniref:Mucin-associated surface protein n=1 Tax=Arthrobacter sp. K5 TaxID=2839623 RepID=A0AAU8EQA5_9MICC
MSPRQTPAAWRRAMTVITGFTLAAAVAGCAGTAPELETGAAAKLQERVLEVTRSAAGSNPAAALKSLARLSSELDAAAAAGQVSFKRHRSITAAINSVRADLTAAQAARNAAAQAAAAKATAAPKPSPTTPPAAAAPVPAPAPAPVPAPANSGRQDSSGKGSPEGNKDKGSGKNKD